MSYREMLGMAQNMERVAAAYAEKEDTPEAWEAWRKADDNLRGWEEAFDPS